MRIAIASSGLGHVARGIETWAAETAVALAENGEDVTLFMARGPVTIVPDTNGALGLARISRLRCLKRGWRITYALARFAPRFAWRWGMTSAYGWEQLSFWLALWPRLRRGQYDVLHVQDPMVALWCLRFRQKGWVNTREILAHGTEESPAFLAQFDFVQHLAPWHEGKGVGLRA